MIVIEQGAPSTVEGIGVRAGARVLLAAVRLRDDRVLWLTVLHVVAFVFPVVPRESDYRFGIAYVPVLLFSAVASVQVSLEVFWMTNDAVPVVLFIGQGAQGAIVEMMGWCAIVQGEWLMRPALATDVREAVGGQRTAASRAVRPARGALAARHEEHARRGVKL